MTVTLSVLYFIINSVLNISLDRDYASLLGIKTKAIDALYHLLLGVAVVLGISVVGVVLVNALLIIPAITAKLFSRSLKNFFFLTPFISILQTVAGLFISVIANLPAGPTIAVFGGIMLLFSVVITRWAE